MKIDVRQLAVNGAKLRLAELDAEREAILAEFPQLRPAASAPVVRPKRVISAKAAAARAAGLRAYWAKRKIEAKHAAKLKREAERG